MIGLGRDNFAATLNRPARDRVHNCDAA